MKRRNFLTGVLSLSAITTVPAVSLATGGNPGRDMTATEVLERRAAYKPKSLQQAWSAVTVSPGNNEFHVFPDAENKMLISADGVVWMDPELKFTRSFDAIKHQKNIRMDANVFGTMYHDHVIAYSEVHSYEDLERSSNMVFMRMLRKKGWYYHGPLI